MASALEVVWPAAAGEAPEEACLVAGNRFETCWAESHRKLAAVQAVQAVQADHSAQAHRVVARSEASAAAPAAVLSLARSEVLAALVAVLSVAHLVAAHLVAARAVGQAEALSAPVVSQEVLPDRTSHRWAPITPVT